MRTEQFLSLEVELGAVDVVRVSPIGLPIGETRLGFIIFHKKRVIKNFKTLLSINLFSYHEALIQISYTIGYSSSIEPVRVGRLWHPREKIL